MITPSMINKMATIFFMVNLMVGIQGTEKPKK